MTTLAVQPASSLGQSLSSGPTDLFNLTLAQRALDGRDVSLYSRLCSRKPCLQNHSSPHWEFTTETVKQRTPRSLRANTTLTRGLPRRHTIDNHHGDLFG